jgi:hypothetical protein
MMHIERDETLAISWFRTWASSTLMTLRLERAFIKNLLAQMYG